MKKIQSKKTSYNLLSDLTSVDLILKQVSNFKVSYTMAAICPFLGRILDYMSNYARNFGVTFGVTYYVVNAETLLNQS